MAMMRATAEAAGRAGLAFRYQALRAALLVSQGRLDDAHTEARDAVALAAEPGYPGRIAIPLVVLVETALRRAEGGDARGARRCGPVAQGMVSSRHYAAALVTDARGDATAVGQALAPPRVELEAQISGFANLLHNRLPQLVQIACTRATMTPHVCSRRRRSSPSRTRTWNALAVAGGHAGALIDHDPAPLREAVKRAATSQDRLLEAAAREDLGRMPAARPASPEAAGQLDAAYDIYLQADADRDTARVRAALRALGIRERQGSAAEPQHGPASPGPSRASSAWWRRD